MIDALALVGVQIALVELRGLDRQRAGRGGVGQNGVALAQVVPNDPVSFRLGLIGGEKLLVHGPLLGSGQLVAVRRGGSAGRGSGDGDARLRGGRVKGEHRAIDAV